MDTQKNLHLLHYLALYVGLSVILVLFIVFRHNYTTQLILAAVGSVYYMLWGIIHHVLEKRINRLLVLEYILFGLLAFVLVYTALNL
jgi:hypothetical protein